MSNEKTYQLIVSAFPESAVKLVTQYDDDKRSEQFCFAPEFEGTLQSVLHKEKRIGEIYILGPEAYINRFVDIAKDTTNIPIYKEGL